MWGNDAAKPEYATAKIAVWWDMNDCRIPAGYDARRVRPSIEGAFKKLGYSGPVSITAYGDQTQTPDDLLRGLSSTGVAVAHTNSESTCSLMFSDMLEWRGHNPPPATMMLISDQVEDVFSWDLVRLQQQTKYNLFLAYSFTSEILLDLVTSAEWRWKKLLANNKHEEEIICCSELSAMFYCKSCNFDGQSLEKFRKHLSSKAHALEVTKHPLFLCVYQYIVSLSNYLSNNLFVKQELSNPTDRELAPVTRMWGRNYAAKPEYATAKIAVWWDMNDCPIPEGYDAHRVRPSIEGAFKKLGYSGPVSITAYGDQTQTPDHLLQGLSSTGVAVAHTNSDVKYKRMFSDLLEWQDLNPPPATMMLISHQVEDVFSKSLVGLQQLTKYNLFLAYSFRPYKMSILVTSAEWLWESLLAETRRHLQKCSERGESTELFYCKSCYCDCKSLYNFRKHLSSKEHELEEGSINACIRLSEYERQQWLEAEIFPKSKRLRKAFRTGFRLLPNYLRLTNRGARRRARKSQTCKKEW